MGNIHTCINTYIYHFLGRTLHTFYSCYLLLYRARILHTHAHTLRASFDHPRRVVCEGEWDRSLWQDQLEEEMVQTHTDQERYITTVLPVSYKAMLAYGCMQ